MFWSEGGSRLSTGVPVCVVGLIFGSSPRGLRRVRWKPFEGSIEGLARERQGLLSVFRRPYHLTVSLSSSPCLRMGVRVGVPSDKTGTSTW